jgi:peptidoglycan/LPS O-acetylase OafA/YrhL
VERILLRRVPVVFPFFCGIYLFRLQMRAESSRIRLPLTLLAGILLAVLLIPMVVGNWPYENLAVLIVFPAIVRLGAAYEPGLISTSVCLFVRKRSYRCSCTTRSSDCSVPSFGATSSEA